MNLPKTVFGIDAEAAYQEYLKEDKTGKGKPAPKLQPPLPLATSIDSPEDYIILKDEPKYRVLVSKYRLGTSSEVEKAAKTLGLTLQNTATEQTSGRGYIGSINHEQALNLNVALESFTLAPRYFIDLLGLLNSKTARGGTGNIIAPAECLQIYEEITKVRNPWRGEWLDASFSMQGKRLRKKWHITYNKINPDGTIQRITEPLDDDALMENKIPGIDLEQLLANASSQGLPKTNIPAGNLYYWGPVDSSVAGFGANSVRANLGCSGGATYSDAELGVRRAKILAKK